MKNTFAKASVCFAAGSVGGFLNSIFVWGFGVLGITGALGVKIAPALTEQWLYPRLVWGGIWGLLFFLPFLKKSILGRGVLFSIAPTLVQLFVVFPMKAHRGVMGLELGILTPLFVIFFNLVWGVTASIWVKLSTE